MNPYLQIFLTKRGVMALCASFFVIMLIIGITVHKTTRAGDIHISCPDLKTAGLNPQALYDTDRVKYKKLDRDGDGLACE